MGACTSKSDSPHSDSHKKVEDKLKQYKKEARKEVKLLLLGTGDSGKSTFTKQLRVLHKGGFSNNDMTYYTQILRDNALSSMRGIVSYISDHKPELLSDLDQKLIEELLEEFELSPELADLIEQLWSKKSVRKIARKYVGTAIQIPMSYPYYFEKCKTFIRDDYVPTHEDIFHSKIKTSGILETKFSVEGINFTVVDVGGQRSERRKWVHCFDDAQAIIYLAAMNEYYMCLEEDSEKNRMQESLELFEEVSGGPVFLKQSWILFLNKVDLFEEQLKIHPISKYLDTNFEDNDVESAKQFVKDKYTSRFGSQNNLYTHFTCALDTDNCYKVFDDIRHNVLTVSLGQGLGMTDAAM